MIDRKLIIKNVTFSLGFSWLMYGAMTYGIMDWDVPLTLIMSGFTYLTAEWCIDRLRQCDFKEWLKVAFVIWFGCDGIYTTYFLLIGHTERMVSDQWLSSLTLYLLCGLIWSYLPKYPDMLALFRAKMPDS